jgi:hypothetical protein
MSGELIDSVRELIKMVLKLEGEVKSLSKDYQRLDSYVMDLYSRVRV